MMTIDKATILFLCSRLNLPGGTEKAIVNTANLFVSFGHKVILLVLDETDQSFYPLDGQVKVLQANLHFGLTKKGNPVTRKIVFASHVIQLRKWLKKIDADIIISTDYPFTIGAWLAVGKSGKKIVSWEHHHFHWLKKSTFWNYFYKKIFPKIDAVVALNKKEQQLFRQFGCQTVVIPNFITSSTQASLKSKFILSVGWLIKRKGIDLVPSIAEKVFKKHPDWKWIIIGSGEEEKRLQKRIAENGLSGYFKIVEPVTHDLTEAYLNASLFVMTSRFECFPMVLLEAMSFGVPCIAFDCPTGPADIIKNKVDGILIEPQNTEAMASAIKDLIENEEKRKHLGASAFENIKRFSATAVYALWNELFLTLKSKV